MNISENIIKDLLPIYLNGDASKETKELIETYMESHPEIRAFLREEDPNNSNLNEPVPEMDMTMLKRAKRYMRIRSIVLGIAIFTFASSFTIIGKDDEILYFMWRDNTEQALVFFGISLVCWISYFMMNKKNSDFIRS